MTRTEALAILAGGDFDPFIGEPESLEVEFKGEPYRLDQEGQKFELKRRARATKSGRISRD
jgi:hypothetical protein